MKWILTILAVLALSTSIAAAGGPGVGDFDRHVAAHHRSCSTPVSGVTWTPLRAVQHFQGGCKIVARYQVITPAPAVERTTATPTPVFGKTPVAPPTTTDAPSPTAVPALPTPTTTPAVAPASDPVSYRLQQINAERASHNYPALTLNVVQSAQALKHSEDMAASGGIWHINPAYPQESFPAEIVVPYGMGGAGENVAATGSYGSWQADLDTINGLYLQEPWSPGCSGNHHCSIDSPVYTSVGIGIFQANGATWETEDFIG